MRGWLFCVLFFALSTNALVRKPASTSQYDEYLKDTLQGLEQMRGTNGLVVDHSEIIPGDSTRPPHLKTLGADTGPTNIALDLLVQTAITQETGTPSIQAKKNLEQVLSTLSRLPYHKDSGLFFRLYPTDRIGASKEHGGMDLSSVDNIHLAVALWTVSQNFDGQSIGDQAKALFDRMDFSTFYDDKTGLAYGNVKYDETNRSWKSESWNYGNFGSEARNIYGLGYALGLFKKQKNDPAFIPRIMKNMRASMYRSKYGKILQVYDGGGFQLLLPEMITAESHYSTVLGESANAYSLSLGEGKKSPGGFPNAFSACQSGLDSYIGQAGSPELVINPDYCDPKLQDAWNSVYTPHAAVMAASTSDKSADILAKDFEKTQSYTSGADHLYNPGIGWADGVIVKGGNRGKIVPVVISLDQEMLALAILKMKDPLGGGPSGAALFQNKGVRAKLESYYKALDRKLSRAPVHKRAMDCKGLKLNKQ